MTPEEMASINKLLVKLKTDPHNFDPVTEFILPVAKMGLTKLDQEMAIRLMYQTDYYNIVKGLWPKMKPLQQMLATATVEHRATSEVAEIIALLKAAFDFSAADHRAERLTLTMIRDVAGISDKYTDSQLVVAMRELTGQTATRRARTKWADGKTRRVYYVPRVNWENLKRTRVASTHQTQQAG